MTGKRRFFIFFLAALALVCGGCSVPSGQTTAQVSPASVVTLSVLAGQSTSDAGIEEMIDQMLAESCPGIKLEWECVDWGEVFIPRMTARFGSGDITDIIIGKAQDVATYAAWGNLAPLPDFCFEKIPPSFLPNVTISDQVFGLPYNMQYQGVLYNKEIFNTLGLAPPKTLEEFARVVEVLLDHDIVPVAIHYQEAWSVGNLIMQFLKGELFPQTPDWGDRFRSGTVSFSTSVEARRCFARIEELMGYSWPDVLSVDQFESDSRFAAGQSAMYITGTWSLQLIHELAPDLAVGIFPFPNAAGNNRLLVEPNISFMKSAQTSHGVEVDRVLACIFNDAALAADVADYTKTISVLPSVSNELPNGVQADIDGYVAEKQLYDVTIGNGLIYNKNTTE